MTMDLRNLKVFLSKGMLHIFFVPNSSYPIFLLVTTNTSCSFEKNFVSKKKLSPIAPLTEKETTSILITTTNLFIIYSILSNNFINPFGIMLFSILLNLKRNTAFQ